MTRRYLTTVFLLSLALAPIEGAWTTAVTAKEGDGGRGGDGGGGRGGGDDGGRGGGDTNGRGDDRGSDRGDDGGQGRGRGRGGDETRAGGYAGWGSTSSESAREAVSQGWVLSLGSVLPTVSKAVPGQVLDVELSLSGSGEWRYEFLVLTWDRRYQEVVVDARRNRILQIRRR